MWYFYTRHSHMQRRYDQLMYLINAAEKPSNYWMMVIDFRDRFDGEHLIERYTFNLLKQIDNECINECYGDGS